MDNRPEDSPVDHVAKLARLDLADDELNQMHVEMVSILSHVRQIQELDLSDVPPTASPIPNGLRLRPDIPQDGLSQAEALANAPMASDGRFKVPPFQPSS